MSPLYKTMDAAATKGLFWPGLLLLWPMPFQLQVGDTSSIQDEDMSLMVACVGPDDARLLVRVCSVEGDVAGRVDLDVVLHDDGRFISGSCAGMTSDELGCVDALEALSPLIKGRWELDSVDAEDEGREYA